LVTARLEEHTNSSA